MRKLAALFPLVVLLGTAIALQAQSVHTFPPPHRVSRRTVISPRILAAKSVYLDNETGYSTVGREALSELAAWGRFRVVGHDQAQLLIILSTQEFIGDDFPIAGDFDPSTAKLPRKPQNAFLTVIDRPTGDRLWIDSRPWGGLLTGANSAGRRLIAHFRKRVEHTRPPS
jgi:hypothetical protein